MIFHVNKCVLIPHHNEILPRILWQQCGVDAILYYLVLFSLSCDPEAHQHRVPPCFGHQAWHVLEKNWAHQDNQVIRILLRACDRVHRDHHHLQVPRKFECLDDLLEVWVFSFQARLFPEVSKATVKQFAETSSSRPITKDFGSAIDVPIAVDDSLCSTIRTCFCLTHDVSVFLRTRKRRLWTNVQCSVWCYEITMKKSPAIDK